VIIPLWWDVFPLEIIFLFHLQPLDLLPILPGFAYPILTPG
jgi:hypothetical protein